MDQEKLSQCEVETYNINATADVFLTKYFKKNWGKKQTTKCFLNLCLRETSNTYEYAS